jgi:hypothetical protein
MGKLLSLFLKLPRKALEKSLVAERRIFEFGRTVNPIGVEKGIELLKWKRELKQLCWVFAKKSFKLFSSFKALGKSREPTFSPSYLIILETF